WSRQQPNHIVLFWGAIGLFFLVSIGFPLLPVQNFLLSLALASLVGGFLVGSSVLIETSLTDILEKTPEPAYGLAFGLWRFGTKISRAIGSLIAGPLLAWASVEAPNLQTSERLGILFGPAVGIFFLFAALLLWKSGLQKKS
ncbi:MAG: MFS transporter, partial [Bdellovibrio sp.]